MTTAVAVATMKSAQVTAAGADLKIVELEIPDPGPGQVRIKVQACGVPQRCDHRRRPPARNLLSTSSRA
jgi:Zn-dependent alcohol dehydrogenase